VIKNKTAKTCALATLKKPNIALEESTAENTLSLKNV
jgi:hypothetical protein